MKNLISWRKVTLEINPSILYAFLDYSVRATCPAHLSRLDLRFIILLGEEQNACSSALCNFLYSREILSIVLSFSREVSRTYKWPDFPAVDLPLHTT